MDIFKLVKVASKPIPNGIMGYKVSNYMNANGDCNLTSVEQLILKEIWMKVHAKHLCIIEVGP